MDIKFTAVTNKPAKPTKPQSSVYWKTPLPPPCKASMYFYAGK